MTCSSSCAFDAGQIKLSWSVSTGTCSRTAHSAITIHDEEVLNESLLALARTGVITVNTVKSIQTGKKIQTTVRRLADDANRLRGTKELEDIQKPLSDALKTIAEIFKLQEEMMRRNAYIAASGGLFIDRTYKYLRKQDRRKR